MIFKWVKDNIGFKAVAFVVVGVAIAGAWRVHYNSYDAQLSRLQHANIANLGCTAFIGNNGQQIASVKDFIAASRVMHPTTIPPKEISINSIWPFREIKVELRLDIIKPSKGNGLSFSAQSAANQAKFRIAVVEAMNRRTAEERRIRAVRLECVGLAETDFGQFNIGFVIEQREDGLNDFSILLTPK